MEVCGASPDEFTIEVNPEDILEKGPDYLHALRALGVDRISMGVQSLDDRVLRWMNRRHDAKGAEEAFRMIREAGFGNISVDLIFGYPDCHLEESLKGILSWSPDHISAYQLSIEDGSALAGLVRDGKFKEADDEQCREQYELICSTLRDAGFCHYEISNWALPGKEARHNAAYWKRLPYVGLGPGAHSFDGSVRSWNREDLKAWTREQETLSEEDSRVEAIMLGLRTARGIEASLLDEEICCRMISDGSLIALGNGHVRIPEALFFVSDDIISSLV